MPKRPPLVPFVVRLPAPLVRRLDKLAQGRPDRPTRSALVRAALVEGVAVLERAAGRRAAR